MFSNLLNSPNNLQLGLDKDEVFKNKQQNHVSQSRSQNLHLQFLVFCTTHQTHFEKPPSSTPLTDYMFFEFLLISFGFVLFGRAI